MIDVFLNGTPHFSLHIIVALVETFSKHYLLLSFVTSHSQDIKLQSWHTAGIHITWCTSRGGCSVGFVYHIVALNRADFVCVSSVKYLSFSLPPPLSLYYSSPSPYIKIIRYFLIVTTEDAQNERHWFPCSKTSDDETFSLHSEISEEEYLHKLQLSYFGVPRLYLEAFWKTTDFK